MGVGEESMEARCARYKAERDCARQDAARLRAELEGMRGRLMPEGMEWLVEAWPRFEDGEPVRLLDDFERYGEENGVSAVTMYADGSFALNCRAYSKGERVNRPAPKVVDADGVEIRVGDTVYEVKTGDKFVVERIYTGMTEPDFPEHTVRCHKPGDITAHMFTLDMLTHRAPVLAADGKPLREGETVWISDEGYKRRALVKGEPLKVLAINEEGIVSVLDQYDIAEGRNFPWRFAPSDLTHDRPDSWERLEDDATKLSPYYYARDVMGLGTDKMPPKESRRIEMMRDLVRRAKALAERGK